jgi:hypothetical protein
LHDAALELSTGHEITDLARRAIDRAHGICAQDSEEQMNRLSSQTRDDLAAMVAVARKAQPGHIPSMDASLAVP